MTYDPHNPYPYAKPKKRRAPMIILVVIAAILGLCVTGGIVVVATGMDGKPSEKAVATTPDPTVAPATPTPVRAAPAATTAAPVKSTQAVSVEEQNAIDAAQQYLEFSAFSREGLIHQLSSKAGDGYPVKVATRAVDSLHVDYNEQAARSAKQYLDLGSFSRQGLIEQLSSKAGERFTRKQAEYGVKKAGL